MTFLFLTQLQVVRDLLCSQAIDGNPAVGASLIVWQSLSTATSGDGNVAPDSFPFRALLNARLFLDEIYAEASRRLISAERRYDALLRAAGGACPGRSPKPFLDATLWLLRMAARVTEAGAPIAPFFALLQGAVRRDGRTANVGTFRSDCAFILRVHFCYESDL